MFKGNLNRTSYIDENTPLRIQHFKYHQYQYIIVIKYIIAYLDYMSIDFSIYSIAFTNFYVNYCIILKNNQEELKKSAFSNPSLPIIFWLCPLCKGVKCMLASKHPLTRCFFILNMVFI